MVKQQTRMDKRRTASASAASDKGRPQHSVNPVPPASHHPWRAGLRSPCAAAHAEDSCALPLRPRDRAQGDSSADGLGWKLAGQEVDQQEWPAWGSRQRKGLFDQPHRSGRLFSNRRRSSQSGR